MRRRTAALAAVPLVSGPTPAVLTTPVSAAVAQHYDDFNGDGRRDLAHRGHNHVDRAGGTATVVYGTEGGLDTARPQLIHQDGAGTPGAGEEDVDGRVDQGATSSVAARAA